jgi:hypothetical protein
LGRTAMRPVLSQARNTAKKCMACMRLTPIDEGLGEACRAATPECVLCLLCCQNITNRLAHGASWSKANYLLHGPETPIADRTFFTRIQKIVKILLRSAWQRMGIRQIC